MTVTARRLNRATLARQLLLGREHLPVVDAVERIVALQAQEPGSPYLALWNRVAGFDAKDLDRALADHEIVKATLMRITLHAVAAGDYPWFHDAMQGTLREARLNDRRFEAMGLSIDDTDGVVPDLLDFLATPRSNSEVDTWLEERLGERPRPGPWWALRTYSPVVHAPTGGPWTFGRRPSYRASPIPPVSEAGVESVCRLVRRYLEGFGPATTQDLGQFALLRQSSLRSALERMSDELVEMEGPDGRALLDVPDGAIPDEDVPAPPRLMPMWDSILLAYADRSRVIPDEYRTFVTRRNGDVLPALLIDGFVSGVWRPLDGGIEATAFHPLSAEDWHGLADEAKQLTAFLADREPGIYRRYDNWWSKLPDGEVRVLPG